MSYFTNRPRAYSKPTKEETKELSNLLSKCSAHHLRLIMLSAANESPAVAQSFIKIMKDTNLQPQSYLQPVQPSQQHTISKLCYPDTGLLTPVDLSEDSEMSGTENIQPQPQQHQSTRPESLMPTPSFFASTDPPYHGTTSLKRSNKRKSLADRDDNNPPHSLSSLSQRCLLKRRKPSSQHLHPSDAQSNHNPEKTYCLNCGLWTPNSRFENLHSCIYHPGDFSLDSTEAGTGSVCSWSCCNNSDLKSRGCLITRHKGLVKDMWSLGFNQTADDDDDDGQMSQYARIMSIKR